MANHTSGRSLECDFQATEPGSLNELCVCVCGEGLFGTAVTLEGDIRQAQLVCFFQESCEKKMGKGLRRETAKV